MENHRLRWRVGRHTLECGLRTHVMGVLNVTPDSFSDGGLYFDPETAVARGVEMARDGADIMDVGGESTRPGSEPVPAEAEIDRVIPVVKRLVTEVSVPISIDTTKPEVAEAALDAGADIVNDITGGSDPRMFDVVRKSGAGMVLMHMRGTPKTMQQLTGYEDVVAEVKAWLTERLAAAESAGIERERLAIDPGLGFAKTTEQNLVLMRDIAVLGGLDRPILVGPSRKSFIGRILDAEVDDRRDGTAGAVAWLVANGANVVRVHDVREMARVVRVVDAIRSAGREPMT
jgi:dihydropteroate synthase